MTCNTIYQHLSDQIHLKFYLNNFAFRLLVACRHIHSHTHLTHTCIQLNIHSFHQIEYKFIYICIYNWPNKTLYVFKHSVANKYFKMLKVVQTYLCKLTIKGTYIHTHTFVKLCMCIKPSS